MTSHYVHDMDSIFDNMDSYNVGDTVAYISGNQEDYVKYSVVMENGAKKLQVIDSFEDEEEEETTLEGGKRRRRKMRKTRKNKTRHAKKRTAHKKRTMRKKMVKRTRRAKTLSKRK